MQQGILCELACRCSWRHLKCLSLRPSPLCTSISSTAGFCFFCSAARRIGGSWPPLPYLPHLRNRELSGRLAPIAAIQTHMGTAKEVLIVKRIATHARDVLDRQPRPVSGGQAPILAAVITPIPAAVGPAARAGRSSKWIGVNSSDPAWTENTADSILSAATLIRRNVSPQREGEPEGKTTETVETERSPEGPVSLRAYIGLYTCFRPFSSARVRRGLSRRVTSPSLPKSLISSASLQQQQQQVVQQEKGVQQEQGVLQREQEGVQQRQQHASQPLDESEQHQGEFSVCVASGLVLEDRQKQAQTPLGKQQQSRSETQQVQLVQGHAKEETQQQPLVEAKAKCATHEQQHSWTWHRLGVLPPKLTSEQAEATTSSTSPCILTSSLSNGAAVAADAAVAGQSAKDEIALPLSASGFDGSAGKGSSPRCQSLHEQQTTAVARQLLADVQALVLDLQRDTGGVRCSWKSSALLLQLLSQYDALVTQAHEKADVYHRKVYPGIRQTTNTAVTETPVGNRIPNEVGEGISLSAASAASKEVVQPEIVEPLPLTLRLDVLKCLSRHPFSSADAFLQRALRECVDRLLEALRQKTLILVSRFESTGVCETSRSETYLAAGDIDCAAAAATEAASAQQQAAELLQLLLSAVNYLSLLQQQQQPQLVREALHLFSAVLLMRRTPLQHFLSNQQSEEANGNALLSDADLKAASRACEASTAAGITSSELLDLLLHPLVFRRLPLSSLESVLEAIRVEANARHVQQLRDQLSLCILFEETEQPFERDSNIRLPEGKGSSSARDFKGNIDSNNSYYTSSKNECSSSSSTTRSSKNECNGSISSTGSSSECEVEGDSRGTYTSGGSRSKRKKVHETSSRHTVEKESSSLVERKKEKKRSSGDMSTAAGRLRAELIHAEAPEGEPSPPETRQLSIDRTRLAAKAFAALTAVVDVDTQTAEEVLQKLEAPLRSHLKCLDSVTLAAVQRGVRLLISSKEAALRSTHQQHVPSTSYFNSSDSCHHLEAPLPSAAPIVSAETPAIVNTTAPRIYKRESLKKKAFFYPRGAGDTLRLQRQADMYASWLALLEILYSQLQQRLRAIEKRKTFPANVSSQELLSILRLLPGRYFDSFAHHRGKILRLRLLLWTLLRKQQPVKALSTTQLLLQLQLLLLHSLYLSDPDALLEHVRELDVRQRPDLLYTENQRQLAAAIRTAAKMNDLQGEAKQLLSLTASQVLLAVLTPSQGCQHVPCRLLSSHLAPQQHPSASAPITISERRETSLSTRRSFPRKDTAASSSWRDEDHPFGRGSVVSASRESPNAMQQQSEPRVHVPQHLRQVHEEERFNSHSRRQRLRNLLPQAPDSCERDAQLHVTFKTLSPSGVPATTSGGAAAELRRRRVRLETLVDTTAALQRSDAADQHRKQLWAAVASFYARHSKPIFDSLVQQRVEQNLPEGLQMPVDTDAVSSIDPSSHTADGRIGFSERDVAFLRRLGRTNTQSSSPASTPVAADTSFCLAGSPGNHASQGPAAVPVAAASTAGVCPADHKVFPSDIPYFSAAQRGSQEAGMVGSLRSTAGRGGDENTSVATNDDVGEGVGMAVNMREGFEETGGFDMSAATCFSLPSRVLRRRLLLFKKQVACEEEKLRGTSDANFLSPAAAAIAILEYAQQQQQQRDTAEFIRWLRCGVLLLQQSLNNAEKTGINTRNILFQPTMGTPDAQQYTSVLHLQSELTKNRDLLNSCKDEVHCEKQHRQWSDQVPLHQLYHLQKEPSQRQQQLAQLVFGTLLKNPQVEGSAGKVPLLEIIPHGMIAEALYAFCCMRFHKTQTASFNQLLAKLPAPLVPVDDHVAMLLWKALATLLQEGDEVIRWRFSRFTHDTLNPLAWAAKASPEQLEKLFRSYKGRCQRLFKEVAAALHHLTVHFTPWPSAAETDGLPLAFVLHLSRSEVTQMEKKLFFPSFSNTQTQHLLRASRDKDPDAMPSQVQVPVLHPGSLQCHGGCEEQISSSVRSYEGRNSCSKYNRSPVSQLEGPSVRQAEQAAAEWEQGMSSAHPESTFRASHTRSKTLRIGVLLIPSAFSAGGSESICEETARLPANSAVLEKCAAIPSGEECLSNHDSMDRTTSVHHLQVQMATSSAHPSSWASASLDAIPVLPRNRYPTSASTGGDIMEGAAAPDVFLCKGKNVGEHIAGALRAKGWKRLVVLAEDEWCQQKDTSRRIIFLAACVRTAVQPRASMRKDTKTNRYPAES